MPDSTMDGLPPAGPLTGAEIFPMVQGASDVRDTLNSILAFVASNYVGETNLTASVNATTITVLSDTGTDALIPAATTGDAGAMTAADKVKLNSIATGATANSSDATLLNRANHTGAQSLITIGDVTITASNLNLLDDGVDTTLHFHDADRARANHTGTQPASTISDFSEAVDDRVNALLVQGTNVTFTYDDPGNTLTINAATQAGTTNLSTTVAASTVTINSDTGADATIPAATGSDAGVLSAADKTKLDGIASGATANSSDATLLARSNHTGQQPASTISDFSEAVDDRVSSLLVAGTNITFTYDDPSNTLTIDAAAGAGQAGVQFQDEGSNLGTSGTATTVDFVGAGVTASRVSNTVTVTIPGGGGQSSIQFQEEGSNLGSSGTITSFNVVGPSATLSRSTDALTLTIAATQGRHSIPILAGSMRPSVTGGCSTLATLASAANQPDIQTLDFDTTTQEYAQFSIPMPKSWNEGTVTFKPIWSHAATTTNFGVVWDLQAVAVSDDDAIAVAFGTAQTSTDTGGTTDDAYIGPESSTITVAGTPAAEDLVFFRISRVTGNGSDTLAIDARLHGIVLYITTDAENDA